MVLGRQGEQGDRGPDQSAGRPGRRAFSGKDGGLIEARKMHIVHQADAGQSAGDYRSGHGGRGDPRSTRRSSTPFPGRGLFPSSPRWALERNGETYNINADLVASHIAVALSAGRLMLLTDVDGVVDADDRLISSIDAATIRPHDRRRQHQRRHDSRRSNMRLARHRKNGVKKVPIPQLASAATPSLLELFNGSGDRDGSNRIGCPFRKGILRSGSAFS